MVGIVQELRVPRRTRRGERCFCGCRQSVRHESIPTEVGDRNLASSCPRRAAPESTHVYIESQSVDVLSKISVTEGRTQPGPFDSHGGFDADPIVHGFAKASSNTSLAGK